MITDKEQAQLYAGRLNNIIQQVGLLGAEMAAYEGEKGKKVFGLEYRRLVSATNALSRTLDGIKARMMATPKKPTTKKAA